MLISVDAATDLAEFLTGRRAGVAPEQVGLPAYGQRRVEGLRREEVASLAGVNVEYCKRLACGNARSTRSQEFRTWWAAHNVRYHRSATKRLRHPVIGELELAYEVMDLASDGLTVSVYSAEPGTRPEEALNLLGSWAATPQEPPTTAEH